MDYICRYRHYYPAESRDDVWFEVSMAEGYAMIAGAMSLDGWLQFSGVAISDGGYILQEVKKLMEKKP